MCDLGISMKHLVMCMVYTNLGGINKLSPIGNFPIYLMLIQSCLIYHNILLNKDLNFSIKFSGK